ncbi:MAG: thiamine diphosphokinase [Anaerosomatales bacterium]|nr:thiamine diphosphokinase [Anaerosomatales bacterium]
MTSHALIVGAAPVPDSERFYRDLIERFDVVVACDAAAEWCLHLGCVPTWAVGDFDSALPGAEERLAAAGVEIAVHPRDKDFTDLDLAASHAVSIGAASLTFTAAYSGRLDHTLAAIGTVRRHADLAPAILEPAFTAWLLSDRGRPSLAFDAGPGAAFSVVALDPVRGLAVRGGRYAAEDLDLDPLSSRAISNVSLGSRIEVEIRSGCALVMLLHSEHNAL